MRNFVQAALLGVAMAAVDYTTNGANWGDACATGKEQSPIDLKDQTYNENLKWSTTGYKDYA